jgi:hypothetical protein
VKRITLDRTAGPVSTGCQSRGASQVGRGARHIPSLTHSVIHRLIHRAATISGTGDEGPEVPLTQCPRHRALPPGGDEGVRLRGAYLDWREPVSAGDSRVVAPVERPDITLLADFDSLAEHGLRQHGPHSSTNSPVPYTSMNANTR